MHAPAAAASDGVPTAAINILINERLKNKIRPGEILLPDVKFCFVNNIINYYIVYRPFWGEPMILPSIAA